MNLFILVSNFQYHSFLMVAVLVQYLQSQIGISPKQKSVQHHFWMRFIMHHVISSCDPL